MATVTDRHSAILDLVMCSMQDLCNIRGLESVRESALATDHVLVLFDVRCELTPQKPSKSARNDFGALQTPSNHCLFVQTFSDSYQCMRQRHSECLDHTGASLSWAGITDASHQAESKIPLLPPSTVIITTDHGFRGGSGGHWVLSLLIKLHLSTEELLWAALTQGRVRATGRARHPIFPRARSTV